MKLQISGKQLKLTEDIKAYVDEHVVRPLNRFYDNEAAELRVELGDSRPRKGGEDIECHLTLHMPGARTIQIEETTQDQRSSIDAAADRLIRAVHKELEKMRETGRPNAS